MEEARKTRRSALLVAIVGILALAAVWATVALAGGSSPAAKPVQAKAKATPAQSSHGHRGLAGKSGAERCPFQEGASNDL
ncbi:MAG TPA: hypothetical protein VIF36_04705 [Gaiellaceae bacterium]|jgi:hypothetical protein